jgi:glycosyltransferase involved in cell wall biosynthesis
MVMRTIAVIPCFNEEKNISVVVLDAKKYVDKVIVVDNGSGDNTVRNAQLSGAEVLSNILHRGAGASTWMGIQHCLTSENADIIITLDGDGQHDPNEIPALVKALLDSKSDLVVGSRLIDSHQQMPAGRRVGNFILNLLFNVGSKNKVTDTQCGFRCFSKEVFKTIVIEEIGFGFCTEVLVKARAQHLKVGEVPVRCIYHNPEQDNTSPQLAHGASVALKTIKWRLKVLCAASSAT